MIERRKIEREKKLASMVWDFEMVEDSTVFKGHLVSINYKTMFFFHLLLN